MLLKPRRLFIVSPKQADLASGIPAFADALPGPRAGRARNRGVEPNSVPIGLFAFLDPVPLTAKKQSRHAPSRPPSLLRPGHNHPVAHIGVHLAAMRDDRFVDVEEEAVSIAPACAPPLELVRSRNIMTWSSRIGWRYRPRNDIEEDPPADQLYEFVDRADDDRQDEVHGKNSREITLTAICSSAVDRNHHFQPPPRDHRGDRDRHHEASAKRISARSGSCSSAICWLAD